MIFYMSGGEIEDSLQKAGIKNINLMMSFFPSFNKKKPEKRFLRIYKARKRKAKK